MSTDLTEKFNALETQLSDQHDAVMAALGGIDTKLSTISSRMFWDNGEDTFTLAQLAYLSLLQLQAIKDSNDSLVTRSSDIYDTLNGFYDEYGDMRSKLTNISNYLFDIRDNIGYPLDADGTVIGRLIAVLNKLTSINTAMGVVPGDATTTVLGRLTAIQNCGCRTQPGESPATAPCEHPFASCGMVLIPFGLVFGTSVNTASFCEPLPEGVSFESFFSLTDDTTEIGIDTTWDGWQVYVSSDGPTFALSPLSATRYPTNKWLPLSGTDSLAFATDARNGLTVYLCKGTSLPGECVVATSEVVTTPWGSDVNAIDWSGYGFPCDNFVPSTGEFSACIFSTQTLTGWTVVTSDSNVYINQNGGTSSLDRTLMVVDNVYTLAGPTPYLHFYSTDNSFTVTLCPPGA